MSLATLGGGGEGGREAGGMGRETGEGKGDGGGGGGGEDGGNYKVVQSHSPANDTSQALLSSLNCSCFKQKVSVFCVLYLRRLRSFPRPVDVSRYGLAVRR